jgi:hypothetical protein
MSDKPTAEDLRVIENQLGRKPRDVHQSFLSLSMWQSSRS